MTNFFNNVNIERMVWPAMNPNINPIEHLWNILKQRVKKHNIHTLTAFRNALQEEILNLINSMHVRVCTAKSAIALECEYRAKRNKLSSNNNDTNFIN